MTDTLLSAGIPESVTGNEAANGRLFNIDDPSQQPKHILAAEQFGPEYLAKLFQSANEMRELANDPDGRRQLAVRYLGHQLCSLFYEPSTRTRLSFEAAAAKIGMGVVSTENAREFSSAAKGETIEDTIRVLDEYGFSAIVLRHHETGSAAKAADVSDAAIINAGDGKGEHPTQALLDTYTIYENFGRLDNLRVVMGGDLKRGRTVRSLARLLNKYPNNHITFVSTSDLCMEDDVKDVLNASGTTFDETADMEKAFENADVVYWTRLQKERADETSSTATENAFTIDMASLKSLPRHAIIMHPLPRVGEISPEVDHDERAAYFRQAGNGLYVRMALLDSVLQQL